MSAADDLMRRAAALARRGLGFTAPNPCVGALVVRDGRVLAEGWHRACGLPHAEREAIAAAREAGIDTRGAELYVTLEPCNHHGRTPPCTEAVIEAGFAKVVVGVRDPNPDVDGGGAEFLKDRGVEVEIGAAGQACRDLIADFELWGSEPRTYNFLKLALTLDGKIAARSGRPEAVSGPESRARVHELRARVDAVIVGGNTLYADNPMLNVRHAPELFGQTPKDPLAVIVTSRLPAPDASLALLRERAAKTIFWTSLPQASSQAARDLAELGVTVTGLAELGSGLDLSMGFRRLREEHGCHYTLCEGGGRLAMSLVDQNLADELELFIAPRVLGDEQARAAFAGGAARAMADTTHFRVAESDMSGQDVFLRLRPTGDAKSAAGEEG